MELQTLRLLILLANNGNQQIEHINEEYQSGKVEYSPHEIGVIQKRRIRIFCP